MAGAGAATAISTKKVRVSIRDSSGDIVEVVVSLPEDYLMGHLFAETRKEWERLGGRGHYELVDWKDVS